MSDPAILRSEILALEVEATALPFHIDPARLEASRAAAAAIALIEAGRSVDDPGVTAAIARRDRTQEALRTLLEKQATVRQQLVEKRTLLMQLESGLPDQGLG